MFFVPVQATAADKYYKLYYKGTSPSYIVNYLLYIEGFHQNVICLLIVFFDGLSYGGPKGRAMRQ